MMDPHASARHLVVRGLQIMVLAAVATVAMLVAWFYSWPWCGQTFTSQHRARPLAVGLLVGFLLAALPARPALRGGFSRRGLVVALACTAVVLAGPTAIAVFDLSQGTLSGDGMCGLAPP